MDKQKHKLYMAQILSLIFKDKLTRDRSVTHDVRGLMSEG